MIEFSHRWDTPKMYTSAFFKAIYCNSSSIPKQFWEVFQRIYGNGMLKIFSSPHGNALVIGLLISLVTKPTQFPYKCIQYSLVFFPS